MGHPGLVPMCNVVTEGVCWESAGVTVNDIKKWLSELSDGEKEYSWCRDPFVRKK